MLKKQALSSRLTLLGIGSFFLINPLFNIIDILPDVIGYMLIYWGLTKFADLDGRIDSARKKTLSLIFVSAFKMLMLYPVSFGTSNSDKLLATFCFAIVELFLCIYAAWDLFEGASYVLSRSETTETVTDSLDGNTNKSILDYLSNARFLTVLFIIAKLVLSIVPELYSLAETKMIMNIYTDSFYYSLVKSKQIAVLLCMLIVCIIGIFWYISVLKLIRAAKRDSGTLDSLVKKYNADYDLHLQTDQLETLKAGLFFAVFACVCLLDLTVEGIRFLPAALGILIFLLSANILKPLGNFTKSKRILPLIFIIQVLSEAYRYAFVDYSAIVVEQLSIVTVAVSTAVTFVSSASLIYFLITFLADLRLTYNNITGKEAPTFDLVKILFVIFLVLQSVRTAVPTLFAPLSAACTLLGVAWVFFAFRCAYRMVSYYRSLIRFI